MFGAGALNRSQTGSETHNLSHTSSETHNLSHTGSESLKGATHFSKEWSHDLKKGVMSARRKVKAKSKPNPYERSNKPNLYKSGCIH